MEGYIMSNVDYKVESYTVQYFKNEIKDDMDSVDG